MKNTTWDFYVIYNGLTNTYLLMYGDSLDYCWANSSSLSHLLGIIRKLVVKYKTPKVLVSAIRNLSDYKRTPWNESMCTRRLEGESDEFEEDVLDAVDSGTRLLQEKTERSKTLRKKIQSTISVGLKKVVKEEKKEAPKKGLIKVGRKPSIKLHKR